LPDAYRRGDFLLAMASGPTLEVTVCELLETGELLPVGTIAQRVTGQRPSRCTLWRWIQRGVQGGVKLRAVPYLNFWQTTEAAFRDFLARRAESALAPREAVTPASDDDLRAAGLL
jgi:hypothetical protein